MGFSSLQVKSVSVIQVSNAMAARISIFSLSQILPEILSETSVENSCEGQNYAVDARQYKPRLVT